MDKEPFKLEGGDLFKYIEKIKDNIEKTSKQSDKIQIYKKIKRELIEIINKFNVLYIQYKYYELFLTSCLAYINENDHQITTYLSLREIYSYYQIVTKKFLIITNPKEYIFNESIEEPMRNQRKKMFFKHYFQIFIIYYFFTFLVEKIINELTNTAISIDTININDYTDLFDDTYITYLLDEENNIELQKLLVLINLFIFL